MRAALALALVLGGCAAAPRPDRPPGGPGSFGDARALAADPRGTLYVADAASRSVAVLPADGSAPFALGGPGVGPGALAEPVAVEPTNGLAVFVADAALGRVLRFTAEGALAETIAVPEAERPGPRPREDARRGRPVAVAADAAGVLYVAEAGRGVVLRLGPGGDVERVLGASGEGALAEPVGLALGPRGELLVADRGRGVVQTFDAFGAPGRAVSGAAVGGVVGVALGPDGGVFVVGPRGVRTPGGRVLPAAGLRGAAVVAGRVLGLVPTDIVDLGAADE